MSQICLENIVSVRDYCSDEPIKSLSGYDMFDAPEINLATINDIANVEYKSGVNLLKSCVRLALRDIETDFISMLQSNNFVVNNIEQIINTGVFSKDYQNAGQGESGITIYRNPNRGSKKLSIKEVSVYPLVSGEYELNFYDTNKVSKVPITLVADQINTFPIDYIANGESVRITLKNVPTYSSQLTCMTTCNGALPNSCGYVKGFNGFEVQKEGFGINAKFSCECDLTQILCKNSKIFVGKIIYLRARINALEERINTTRLNSFIIYGKEDAINLKIELEKDYIETWNSFIQAIPNVLKNGDECVSCNSTKIITNI